mmetsp:Transcript_16172/g.36970  ORF Transcript_16172/g.36970 Transcript_16172/m.36970 type:complete len:688 (-) Transcript_16172:1697-3760(-)
MDEEAAENQAVEEPLLPDASLKTDSDVFEIEPYQELFISAKLKQLSINVLRFAIFVDAVAGTIEQPNYPIMVLPGAHADSFPSTAPFDFAAATYFVPMAALLGVSISSLVIGGASDKYGRKPMMLLCLYGTVAGCILKYLFRGNFWTYNAFNFLNGLFSASVPVGLAYAGDVNESKREKDAEIGLLVGISMLGAAGGGIIAILMEKQGLFAPLLVGAGVTAVAAILNTFYLIEPRDIVASREAEQQREGDTSGVENDDDDGGLPVPEVMNKKVFGLIILGALGDNIGSSGLMPLCLSPLAFNAFYTDLQAAGKPIIMSEIAYKWISVLVALMVVPGTIVSPRVFNRLGLAGGCVLGNIITGITTIILLYVAMVKPPSTGTFGIFVALLYACYPFTVISQLSTGPMLEATSPPDKRGFSQGCNITVMNFGAALSPFVLGVISDNLGTPVAIWICVAISFLSAFANVPLMWVDGCNVPKKPVPMERRPLLGEDEEVVQKILKGEWVDTEILDQVNEERFLKGRPYLFVRPRPYEDEKHELDLLRKRTKSDFLYHQRKTREYLCMLNERSSDDLATLCNQYNLSMRPTNEDEVESINSDVGKWFISYLKDNGYAPHMDSTLIKEQIMLAFPHVSDGGDVTPESIEENLLRTERVFTRAIEMEGMDEDASQLNFKGVLKYAQSAILQSAKA